MKNHGNVTIYQSEATMNHKQRIFLVLGFIAILAAAALPFVRAPLVTAAATSVTPDELQMLPVLPRMTCTLVSISEDEYLRVAVSMSTNTKRVHLRWEGKASAGADKAKTFKMETVSFEPTALCRSRTNPRAFYIAGRSASGPALEKWQFNNDEFMGVSWEPNPGVWQTTVHPATIAKTSLPVSSGLQNVCDMTAISPSPVSGQSEELWVFEWESRNVFAVSPTTGALTLRVAAATAGPCRSMNARTHSIYGDVVFFDRRPWNMTVMDWTAFAAADPTLDPDRLAIYDQDLNGSMEGSVVIPASQYGTHALYTTGEFTDDVP